MDAIISLAVCEWNIIELSCPISDEIVDPFHCQKDLLAPTCRSLGMLPDGTANRLILLTLPDSDVSPA